MAGNDFDKASRMVGWPLVEVLFAALEVARDQARHAYEVDLQVWAAVAPYAKKDLKPPQVPALLRPRSKLTNV